MQDESFPRHAAPAPWAGAARRLADLLGLLRHRSLRLGLAVVIAVSLCALGADLLSDIAPQEMVYRDRFLPPGSLHWFGTDSFGRDVFSRVMRGSRISLEIGLGVMLITGLSGSFLGGVASCSRTVDNAILCLMDALMAFPTILLAIAVCATLGPSLINVILVLSLTYVPRTARIVRASALSVRELDFVAAARALGASRSRILLRHIIPNGIAPLLVELSFLFSAAVLSEAVLSFLGVGLPPTAPTLGNIIAEGQNYLWDAPWITIFPGLMIVLIVLGLNLLGDGLRDVLDPRITGSRKTA